jgi:hypothetical protein
MDRAGERVIAPYYRTACSVSLQRVAGQRCAVLCSRLSALCGVCSVCGVCGVCERSQRSTRHERDLGSSATAEMKPFFR